MPPALGPDGRVYPLIGGGRAAPRDGLPATRLRIGLVLAAAPMADGSVAVLPFREEPFAVGTDGRVRLLAAPPGEAEEIESLEGAADGALLALRRGRAFRLAPGSGLWAELPRPAAIPASFVPDRLLPLPAGYALVGEGTTWRLEHGVATAVEHPADVTTATVTADGTIVLELPRRRPAARAPAGRTGARAAPRNGRAAVGPAAGAAGRRPRSGCGSSRTGSSCSAPAVRSRRRSGHGAGSAPATAGRSSARETSRAP